MTRQGQEFVVVHLPRLKMVFIGAWERTWLFRWEEKEKKVTVWRAFGPRTRDEIFWRAADLARAELKKMRQPELQLQGASR